jgi:rfaE bifunctional protein kinase chain/domain
MKQAATIFEDFNKINVLIVGDVMIDRYLNGHVSRISPEAPVPVVHLQDNEDRLGGAGNVALNIRALGATPFLCSMIGNDEDSAALLRLLPENGMTNEHILTSQERVTTVKTRILSNNQHLLRIDREDNHDLSAYEAELFLENIRHTLATKNIQVILLQDYNKGVLSLRVINEVIAEGIKRGIPMVVDPKFKNFWAYRGVTLFKPNLKEIRAQLPDPIGTDLDALQHASLQIQAKLGNRFTMITLSEKGLFIAENGVGKVIPTQPRAVADVCGAGDTVVSISALGLALKLPMLQVAILSNLAGGQVCERVGVVPVDKAQLLAEFESLEESKLE